MATPKFEAEILSIPSGCSPAEQARNAVADYRTRLSQTSTMVRNTQGEVIRLRDEYAEASNLYNELAEWQADKLIALEDFESCLAEEKASAPQRVRDAFDQMFNITK